MQNFNGEALQFNAAARLDRAIDQLIGICAGISADGEINDHEIAFLSTWLSQNRDVCRLFPGNQIAARLSAVLADGVITEEERADLLEVLQQISGNRFLETGSPDPDESAIPADSNPDIIFTGKRFCFTGKFAFGTRSVCEASVIDRGGLADGDVTLRLDYLVLGVGVSKDWKHQTYGRKIEKAMKLREGSTGAPMIISEADWVAAMDSVN